MLSRSREANSRHYKKSLTVPEQTELVSAKVRVNGYVLVFNLSLSPCGLSRELFYSVPLCCALSFWPVF